MKLVLISMIRIYKMGAVRICMRSRKTLTLIAIALCGVTLMFLLIGFIGFPRPDLPRLISEDACSRYNIQFDGTSIETIYLSPDTIITDPKQLLQEDTAYLMFAEHRARVTELFQMDP